jgi:hypothetical protein
MESDGEGKVETMKVQRLSHHYLVETTVKSIGPGFVSIEGYQRQKTCASIIPFSKLPFEAFCSQASVKRGPELTAFRVL